VEIGSGKGYSKKESHQMAAKVAIKKLRESDELQDMLLVATQRDASDVVNSSIATVMPDKAD
jgi:ribonuclease-3